MRVACIRVRGEMMCDSEVVCVCSFYSFYFFFFLNLFHFISF